MNYRSMLALGSVVGTFAGFLGTIPAGAQTIDGLSNSSYTLNYSVNAGLDGVPSIDDSTGTAQLTTDNPAGGENTSVFYNSQVDVSSFTASFDYLFGGAGAAPLGPGNGFTFIVQDDSLNALGTSGFGNGPQGDPDTITPSVALETNLFPYFGQAVGTAVSVDGDYGPFRPDSDTFFDTTGSVNLVSGDLINYAISYDGTNLTETLTDLTTSDTFTDSYAVDIVSALGSTDGWVGFTGGTGGADSNQYISDFTFTSGATPAPESSTIAALALLLMLGVGGMCFKTFRGRSSAV